MWVRARARQPCLVVTTRNVKVQPFCLHWPDAAPLCFKDIHACTYARMHAYIHGPYVDTGNSRCPMVMVFWHLTASTGPANTCLQCRRTNHGRRGSNVSLFCWRASYLHAAEDGLFMLCTGCSQALMLLAAEPHY